MKLTSPKTIKEIAQHFGFTFKKGLGQNFLTSDSVISNIAEAAQSNNGILEIGPGFGVLTHELSRYTNKVVSLEIDERLIEILSYTLNDCDNVKIINADALKIDLHKLIAEEFSGNKINVAANLPYYITTPIITRLLEEKLPIDNIIVMVQKEVAQRMKAQPSSKDYGAITLLCKYYADAEIIDLAPARMFIPPPKVDSAVLRLHMLDKPRVSVIDEKIFFSTVKAAFSQRRKTLLNCISSYFSISKPTAAELLEKSDIEQSRRGETLSIEEFAVLSDNIALNIKQENHIK